MGIRLYKTMGYGMTIEEFNDCYQPRWQDSEENSPCNHIMEILLPESVEVLSKDYDQDIINTLSELGYQKPFVFPIINGKGQRYSLCKLISSGDDFTHIIFFPTESQAKSWNRGWDDLDYAALPENPDYETRVVEKQYGFYPWNNRIRCSETNLPIEWGGFVHMSTNGIRPDTIVPDVPEHLVYWLLKLNVFEYSSIQKLRPMYAEYWS